METLTDIGLFLHRFKAQKDQFGLVFFPRERTFQGLIDLEMTSSDRDSVLNELVSDYFTAGPFSHPVIRETEVWEFKTQAFGKETRIRLSLGLEKNAVFCLAFEPENSNYIVENN